MTKLKKPNSSITEVLYELITNKEISNANLPYMWGFRARISDLIAKHGINLKSTMVLGKNKHGRTFKYVQHQLLNKKFALKKYNELIK